MTARFGHFFQSHFFFNKTASHILLIFFSPVNLCCVHLIFRSAKELQKIHLN